MQWSQVIDPFNNIAFSALIAILPVLFIFWALIIRRMKGWTASLSSLAIALVIAVAVYRMPLSLSLLSVLNGALYGLFPICWIIVSAVFLFNITVKSGQFEVIRHFLASISADRRIQALLIAFSFGAFLEGTAGFGAPVAITAAMLVALGFNPMYAAGICLIANTAPVAFGSIGIPITVAAQVTSIPEMAISQMVGRTLPVLSFVLPFYLVGLMSGFKRSMEVLPAVLVSGGSFAVLQGATSNLLGPALPDVFAGLGSIAALVVFLRWWQPKNTWRFPHEPPPTINTHAHYPAAQILRACSPFIVLTILVIGWGLPPVKDLLNSFGQVQFEMPGLHNAIVDAKGSPLPHVFKFNYLSAAGTAIFLAGCISVPLLGLRLTTATSMLRLTLRQLAFPVLTVASVLAFAYLVNDSGITLTIAAALAQTGVLFPFFAPVLGWLGVFITGSDTSANALFGKLQAATASSIGVDPVVTVGANVSGGVVGKMISPQSIAVAAAAGGLVGKEADLFRFTVKHSFYMLMLICVIVTAQAFGPDWLIPRYHAANTRPGPLAGDHQTGLICLLIVAAVVICFTGAVMRIGKKATRQRGNMNVQDKEP